MALIGIKLTEETLPTIEASKSEPIVKQLGWIKDRYITEIQPSGISWYLLLAYRVKNAEFVYDGMFLVPEDQFGRIYESRGHRQENRFFEVFTK